MVEIYFSLVFAEKKKRKGKQEKEKNSMFCMSESSGRRQLASTNTFSGDFTSKVCPTFLSNTANHQWELNAEQE